MACSLLVNLVLNPFTVSTIKESHHHNSHMAFVIKSLTSQLLEDSIIWLIGVTMAEGNQVHKYHKGIPAKYAQSYTALCLSDASPYP